MTAQMLNGYKKTERREPNARLLMPLKLQM